MTTVGNVIGARRPHIGWWRIVPVTMSITLSFALACASSSPLLDNPTEERPSEAVKAPPRPTPPSVHPSPPPPPLTVGNPHDCAVGEGQPWPPSAPLERVLDAHRHISFDAPPRRPNAWTPGLILADGTEDDRRDVVVWDEHTIWVCDLHANCLPAGNWQKTDLVVPLRLGRHPPVRLRHAWWQFARSEGGLRKRSGEEGPAVLADAQKLFTVFDMNGDGRRDHLGVHAGSPSLVFFYAPPDPARPLIAATDWWNSPHDHIDLTLDGGTLHVVDKPVPALITFTHHSDPETPAAYTLPVDIDQQEDRQGATPFPVSDVLHHRHLTLDLFSAVSPQGLWLASVASEVIRFEQFDLATHVLIAEGSVVWPGFAHYTPASSRAVSPRVVAMDDFDRDGHLDALVLEDRRCFFVPTAEERGAAENARDVDAWLYANPDVEPGRSVWRNHHTTKLLAQEPAFGRFHVVYGPLTGTADKPVVR